MVTGNQQRLFGACRQAGAVAIAGVLALCAVSTLPWQPRAAADEKPAEKSPELQTLVSSAFPGNKIYSRVASVDAQPMPEDKPAITSASGVLHPFPNGVRPDPEVTLKSIGGPSQMAVVQVVFTFDQAATYLKPARLLAADLQTIGVQDEAGRTTIKPSGYMLAKGDDLVIKLDIANKIQSISDIKALDQVRKGDHLHVIFHVPKGMKLAKLVAANQTVAINAVAK